MASGTTGAPPAAPTKPPPQDEQPPSRASLLLRDRKRLLIALGLLALAAAIAIGTSAVFTSSAANPSNTFSAGTLAINDDKEGSAILTASKMQPGDSQSGQVTIENSGDSDGVFSLDDSALTDTQAGAGGGKLSTVLTLNIRDLGADGAVGGGDDTITYNGKFDAMPPISLGTWSGGESHKYEFTVTFPDAGLPPSATTGDNAYQGAAVSVTYNWSAVST
jgi:hypothetical protein